MKMRQLPPKASERVLADTAMDIMVAAQGDNEIGFYSTHRSNVSWFALVTLNPRCVEVWELTGVSRTVRINMETNIRNQMHDAYSRRQESK